MPDRATSSLNHHGDETIDPATAESTAAFLNLTSLGRAMGPELLQQTRALIAALQPGPDPDVRLAADLAYGPDPRHRLDLFAPRSAPAGSGLPVLVFVHGGSFASGDKHTAGTPYFHNIGYWAARHGWVAALVNYRLVPQVRWPAGRADLGLALEWLGRAVGARGGDPRRIHLMGHSAGASLVADWLAATTAPAEHGVVGGLLLSGVYDPRRFPPAPWLTDYYGPPGPEHSTLPGLARARLPLAVVVAELEPPEFHGQAELVHAARHAAGHADGPPLYLTGHNHYSVALHVNAVVSPLTALLRELAQETWTNPLTPPHPAMQGKTPK